MAFGQSAWVLVICVVIAVVFVMVKGNPVPSATASCSCQPGTMALADQVDKIQDVKRNVKRILDEYKTLVTSRFYRKSLNITTQVLRLSEAGSVSLAATRGNCLLNIVQIIDSIRNSGMYTQRFDNQLNRTTRMTCDACYRLTPIECIYQNDANDRSPSTFVRRLRDIYLVTCEMVRRGDSSASACSVSDL